MSSQLLNDMLGSITRIGMKVYRHKYIKFLWETLVGVVLILSMTVSTVSAATNNNPNGFQVSPVRTELTINRGDSQTVNITIANPTNSQLATRALVNDFIANTDESGAPLLITDNSVPLPHNNFISLVSPIPNFVLLPKQSTTMPVRITVPANANAGGYYGAIRFAPASLGTTSNIGLSATVGSLFLITVPGNLVEKLNLIQLSAAHSNGDPSWFFVSGDLAVMTRLQNVGDIHVQPFGTVIVKDMFGHVLTQYEFNPAVPDRSNVLPDSVRKFVDKLPKHHWFGRYTIQESIAYQQGTGNLLYAHASFWYVSQWYLVALLVIVVLLFVVIYWRIEHNKKKRYSHRR